MGIGNEKCGQSMYSLGRLEKHERNFRIENPHFPVIQIAYSDNALYKMKSILKYRFRTGNAV